MLTILALVLLAGDILLAGWYYNCRAGTRATVIHVGLDSYGMIVPENQPMAKLIDGKWQPDPAADPSVSLRDGPERLAMVSLAPDPGYGHFLQVIRDLRARGLCNVAILEGGTPHRMSVPLPGGSRDAIEIQAILLCGHTLGDSGFTGQLPPDSEIRL
ncbi:hypothetical protein [Sphingomonas caeni]|uniref:hypothetical protein n=1 Tax=Sphingomonas caeni TaxID=2984949 RepID=UPI0022302645|nr:hypothetical protein [Sphingomonas caeni]